MSVRLGAVVRLLLDSATSAAITTSPVQIRYRLKSASLIFVKACSACDALLLHSKCLMRSERAVDFVSFGASTKCPRRLRRRNQGSGTESPQYKFCMKNLMGK